MASLLAIGGIVALDAAAGNPAQGFHRHRASLERRSSPPAEALEPRDTTSEEASRPPSWIGPIFQGGRLAEAEPEAGLEFDSGKDAAPRVTSPEEVRRLISYSLAAPSDTEVLLIPRATLPQPEVPAAPMPAAPSLRADDPVAGLLELGHDRFLGLLYSTDLLTEIRASPGWILHSVPNASLDAMPTHVLTDLVSDREALKALLSAHIELRDEPMVSGETSVQYGVNDPAGRSASRGEILLAPGLRFDIAGQDAPVPPGTVKLADAPPRR